MFVCFFWCLLDFYQEVRINCLEQVLHCIPACERKAEEPQAAGVSGPAPDVPLHTVHLQKFLPELKALISYFHLPYDAEELQSSADEMELFSLVWKEFRTIFKRQEQMKTFPQYGGSDIRDSQWGRKSAEMALKKQADWIPYIQVKPRQDPWQQKLITKLKEKDAADELLLMNCSFLQVPHLLHVAAALKERAARAGDSTHPPSSSSHGSRTKSQKVTEIWTKLYNADLFGSTNKHLFGQETHSHSCRRKGGVENPRTPTCSSSNRSHSFEDSLQVLGLEDGLEEGTSNPVVSRGAYLSLIYLRHLKLRELQRVSLGLLNYLRSVERTLTFDLAGLQLEEEGLCSTAEETGWMNAARGGRGEAGGLGSLQYVHNTPVDYKVGVSPPPLRLTHMKSVCCSEFMEFAEVENLHDFYTSEQRFVHTQDHRGLYIVYDAALKDLEELKKELLLVGSHFIHRNRIRGKRTSETDMDFWAGTDIDRVAVLLDLWTCEAEFLENKVQLLNCYYEAYQHAAGAEERCALATVITDIMHRRPQLDLTLDYFVQAYRAEIGCLQSHQQLIRDVLDAQIKRQRLYLERIWREDRKPSCHDYGLPLSCVPQHLVSLSGSSPALMNVFLLEVHPSLCLASAVYHGLVRAHTELCQLHRASSIADKLDLQQKLLQQAQQSWDSLGSPGASYSSQIQKDLFSDVFFEDPLLVQEVGLFLVTSAEDTDMKKGPETQLYAVETFSKLLELVTIRHRLLEAAAETAHLAHLYRNVASELGFGEFHLYLRPLQFELTEPRGQVQPSFVTEILEDNSSVDRFIPSHLPLSIHELDENHIGRFSFSSEDTVTHLMNKQSIENLQVSLACQVTQKNALMSAVKLACLCHWASQSEDRDVTCDTVQDKPSTRGRAAEAFVSIQLEKVGLRDEMLHSFMKRKQAVGGFIGTSEEAASIKRELIIDFLRKFCTQTSLHGVRAQIVASYYSLTVLLHDVPSIRQSHFMIGQAAEAKAFLKSRHDLRPDPRTFQRRPAQLLCADGTSLLNLWYIPHFTEVLLLFKTLQVQACTQALRHTLHIASALHDIVYYLVSFSRLGNREESEPGSRLAADWGGAEGIGTELQEIQQQVDLLSDPSCPRSVGRLLQLHRQVVLLQFDTAVRSPIREAFLSSGDVASYQSVSDNMVIALPLLSDGIQADVFSLTLPVPRPLETRGCQAQRMYPWRSFIACHGLIPLHVWDIPPIEYCMQLCLSGLRDRSRLQANAAILGVSLLMEDILNSGREAGPVRLYDNKDDPQHDGRPNKEDEEEDDEEEEKVVFPEPGQEPIRIQTVLKGFLLLTKQLEVFKESWARRRLGTQVFSTPALYRQFVKLYRAEIFHPSIRALALQMGKECDYEVLDSGSQSLLPPPGASEFDMKAWQVDVLY
ncbi:uncharacterized protein LOC114427829 [Parambassis ranga]|uniref:Uncharacterized protein LOC114427829 n=1 Tax=Parambassis ranga TaxID=210632 RepID=A0A6P7HIX0_9TELE|nr:uncharacterized protein LOC114427829 [Parambassis ranga]